MIHRFEEEDENMSNLCFYSQVGSPQFAKCVSPPSSSWSLSAPLLRTRISTRFVVVVVVVVVVLVPDAHFHQDCHCSSCSCCFHINDFCTSAEEAREGTSSWAGKAALLLQTSLLTKVSLGSGSPTHSGRQLGNLTTRYPTENIPSLLCASTFHRSHFLWLNEF